MGVGRPEDFVTIVNRFPVHYQWFASSSNDRFVTISARNQAVQRAFYSHRPDTLRDKASDKDF